MQCCVCSAGCTRHNSQTLVLCRANKYPITPRVTNQPRALADWALGLTNQLRPPNARVLLTNQSPSKKMQRCRLRHYVKKKPQGLQGEKKTRGIAHRLADKAKVLGHRHHSLVCLR